MTDRERILAAVRGEVPDRLPWVPRLEFWYRARLRDGTLPAELRALTLTEIADRLGMGCYSSIPDFTEGPGANDMVDRALGIFQVPVIPYATTLDGVDRHVIRRGRETVVEYHTPLGSIHTVTLMTDEMLEAGASVPWIVEPAIRNISDFEVVGYIFSHIQVKPRLEGYLARRQEVGERGVVVGYVLGTACPIQHIMKELMPVEEFFFALHDYQEKVHRLAEQMEPFYQQIKEIVAESPAEVVLLGGNYDDSITHPPFFEKYILPPLHDYAELLHRKGKYLMTHADGESRMLLPLYLRAAFDIADSVCPYPMTRCRIEDFRAAFADRITIWGGIPSTLLCPSSTTEEEFRRTVDGLLQRYGRESHFVLGVSDMVTADASWDRMRYITERVAKA